MEENATTTQAPTTYTVPFTPHEIDEDGWVNYTWLEELLPSLMMAAFFCVGAAAVYAGLF